MCDATLILLMLSVPLVPLMLPIDLAFATMLPTSDEASSSFKRAFCFESSFHSVKNLSAVPGSFSGGTLSMAHASLNIRSRS